MIINMIASMSYLAAMAVPVGAGALVYFWPSILAFRKAHARRWEILLINAAFGWTTIGWLVAVIWAIGSNGADGLADNSQPAA